MKYIQNSFYLAWMDIRARYKKSALGPLWLPLGNFISVLGLGIIWGSILKEDLTTFLPSIATGLITWQLISGSIVESCETFTSHTSIIRNVKIPSVFFISRLLSRHLINYLHSIPIIIGVLIYYDLPINKTTSLSIIGIILIFANLAWITFLTALLAARFRDIGYAIASFMPILFFVTPVIFRPDHVPGALKVITDFNPLTHFISVVRSPVLGEIPDNTSYIVVISILLIGSTISYLIGKTYSKRLPFWI